MTLESSPRKARRAPGWLRAAASWIILLVFAGLIALLAGFRMDSSSWIGLLAPLLLIPLVLGTGWGVMWFLERSGQNAREAKEAQVTAVLEQLVPGLDPLPVYTPQRRPALSLALWVGIGVVLTLHWLVIGSVVLLIAVLLSSSAVAVLSPVLMMFVPLVTGLTLVRCWGMVRRYRARGGNLLAEKRLVPLLVRIGIEFVNMAVQIGLLFASFYWVGRLIPFPFGIIVVALLFPRFYMYLSMLPIVIGPLVWIFYPYQRLDYDRALARTRRFKDGVRLFEPRILAEIGEDGPAQEALFETLQRARTRSRVTTNESVFLSYVGTVALFTGRYDDAITGLEAVYDLIVTDGDTLDMLAEAYLLAGTNSARALELTQTALQSRQKFRPILRWIDSHATAEIRATYAWALAANGQLDQARESTTQALAGSDRLPPRQAAGVHFRVGYALRVCGDPKADAHFRRAAEIDARGWAGRMARAALVVPAQYETAA